jgi:hypothetical protein
MDPATGTLVGPMAPITGAKLSTAVLAAAEPAVLAQGLGILAGAAGAAGLCIYCANKQGYIRNPKNVCYIKKCQPESRNRANTGEPREITGRNRGNRAGAGGPQYPVGQVPTSSPYSVYLNPMAPHSAANAARERELAAAAAHIAATRPQTANNLPYVPSYAPTGNPYFQGPTTGSRKGGKRRRRRSTRRRR